MTADYVRIRSTITEMVACQFVRTAKRFPDPVQDCPAHTLWNTLVFDERHATSTIIL